MDIVSVLSSAGCHNSLVHKGQKVVQRSLSDVYEFSPIPDSQVEGTDIPEGKWENEQEVIDSLWERMEWFLLKVMQRDGTWDEPNMAQHAQGGKWGLGKVKRKER